MALDLRDILDLDDDVAAWRYVMQGDTIRRVRGRWHLSAESWEKLREEFAECTLTEGDYGFLTAVKRRLKREQEGEE